MLQQKFLDILCCPACRGDLQFRAEASELHCPACNFTFPVVDDIPVLFPLNVKESMDELFGRHWDSEERAGCYDETVEGEHTDDPFGVYQHESELAGIEACYDPSKLGTLLDAGCGNGRFLATLPDSTIKVGVDASLRLLQATAARGRGDLLVCCELEHIPFKDGVFDTVISCRVLQHLVEQEQGVKEMCRVTRQQGDVILEVYNSWNLKTLYKILRMSRLRPILNAPFQWIHKSFDPFGPWGLDYDRYNSWAELSRYLRAGGATITGGRGAGFGHHKYLMHPFMIHAVLLRIAPGLLSSYYKACMWFERTFGGLFPFKYGMEKVTVKGTK